MTRNNMKNIA